jgi:hypothetical protein
MFIVGWVVGLAVVGVIVLAVAGPTDASDEGDPATWVAVVELVLGALLLLVAVKQWRGRPRDGEVPSMPKWMGAIDGFTPVKSAGAGALLSGVNRRTCCAPSPPAQPSPRRGSMAGSRPSRTQSSR